MVIIIGRDNRRVRDWLKTQDIFSQKASQHYVEGIAGSPNYVNPILCQYNQVDRDLASLVFNGLTTIDANGNVIPDLAQDWAVSGDNLIYTFTLRADVRWHDGAPFSANDVIYTINAIKSPDYRGVPYLAQRWRDVTVKKVNTHTVQFQLPEPFVPFLSYTTIGILPVHILKKISPSKLPEHEFNRAPIGTGPFVVRELDASHALLTSFKNYHQQSPHLSKIEFRFYSNSESLWSAHQRGEINGISEVDWENDGRIASKNLNFYSAPRAEYDVIYLNLQRVLFAEREVRQALLYALNRQLIVDLVLEGRGVVAHSPIMPNSWAYNAAAKTYSYEPDTAAALLDWSGWRDRDGDGLREDGAGNPFSFSLLTDDNPMHQQLAERIVQQWGQVGIDAQVESISATQLVREYLRPRRFDAVLLTQRQPGVDPDPYAQWHSSQNTDAGRNYAGFANDEIDEIIEEARRVTDKDKRAALYYEFQDIFAEEVPALLLYYPHYTYGVDNRVKNVELGILYDASDRFKNIEEWKFE